jgi:hypothetical protein
VEIFPPFAIEDGGVSEGDDPGEGDEDGDPLDEGTEEDEATGEIVTDAPGIGIFPDFTMP